MRLYEFAGADPMVTKLVAITDQIKTDLDNGDQDPNISLPDFLQLLRKYDIFLDKEDLYVMIKQLPLKNLISNIKGDKIVFKGTDDTVHSDSSEDNVVASMAKKAAKIR